MSEKMTSKSTSDLSQHLPFYELNDREINSLFNVWTRDLDLDTDLYDLLPNPNKSDENDPDLMLNNITSNYYSLTKLNDQLENMGRNALSPFHCNVRSLPKNLTLVNDLIYSLSFKPDILAVTETRLNANTVVNVDLLGYNFIHMDSPTAAGGTGIYVTQNLKSIVRTDIRLNMELVESCWIEIDNASQFKKYYCGLYI